MEVGIRDLRNHLSRYLEQVRRGEEITVTDRGKAIARILPMSGERKIDRLIAQGLVTPAEEPDHRMAWEPVEIDGTISDLVIEERR